MPTPAIGSNYKTTNYNVPFNTETLVRYTFMSVGQVQLVNTTMAIVTTIITVTIDVNATGKS